MLFSESLRMSSGNATVDYFNDSQNEIADLRELVFHYDFFVFSINLKNTDREEALLRTLILVSVGNFLITEHNHLKFITFNY